MGGLEMNISNINNTVVKHQKKEVVKETKDCQLKFRLTADAANEIKAYCEKRGMTVSEFIRTACEFYLNR